MTAVNLIRLLCVLWLRGMAVRKDFLEMLKCSMPLQPLVVSLGSICVLCLFLCGFRASASEINAQGAAVLGVISQQDLDDISPSPAAVDNSPSKAKAEPVPTRSSTSDVSSQKDSAPMSFEEAMRQAREAVAKGEILSVTQPPVVTKTKPEHEIISAERDPSLKQKSNNLAAGAEAKLAPVAADALDRKTGQQQNDARTQPVKPIEETKLASKAVDTVVVPPVKSKDAASDFVALLGQVNPPDADLVKGTTTKPDMIEAIALDEAVSLMLRNNFEVKASEYGSDSIKWDRLGAYSQYLPSVEFTYAEGAERSSPGSYNGPDGSRVSETIHHRRDRSLFIRQPIIDLVVVSDIMKAEKQVGVSDAERRDMKESLVFGTVTAFFKLLQSRKAIELADEYKAVLNGLAQRMQARFEEGGATNADIDRINSRIKVAEASRLEAVGAYGSTLSEFKRITGIAPTQYKMPNKLAPDVPSTSAEALDMALKNNPSYLASLIKVDLAASDRNKSYAGILPKLSVEYSNAFTYNAGGTAHGNPIDGVYPNQDDSRIMLVAKWSLTGGTAFASGLSSTAKVQEMRYKSQDVRSRLEQGMATAYDALNAARQRASILKETFQSDQRVVADLEEQFIHGDRSLFEILDSQDRLYNTKTQLLATMFSEAMFCYQIRLQMGEIAKAVLSDMGGA